MATYSYDGNGKRIKTVKADGTVEYAMYSVTGTLLYTDNPVADHIDYIQLGGKTVVQVDGGNPTYLHADLLGSPRMATNSGGGILWNEHYDPYGQKLNGVNEKIGYTGHAYDTETQLTYAQARFYDPAVGRFLSNDPVGFTGNPISFNRYSYVGNSPYGGADPTGMCPPTVSGCDGDLGLQSVSGLGVGNGGADQAGPGIVAAIAAHEGGGVGFSTGSASGAGESNSATGKSGGNTENTQENYPSLDAAAKRALSDINSYSIMVGKEFSGLVISNGDGSFSYGKPEEGAKDSSINQVQSLFKFSLILRIGATPAAMYHTHGAADSPRGLDNYFSFQDIYNSFNSGLPSYVGTPNGYGYRYDPIPTNFPPTRPRRAAYYCYVTNIGRTAP